jgi:hypothetical protein
VTENDTHFYVGNIHQHPITGSSSACSTRRNRLSVIYSSPDLPIGRAADEREFCRDCDVVDRACDASERPAHLSTAEDEDCNTQASGMSGDARKQFMSTCLSGGAAETKGPHCTKGKPCGNSCIAMDKVCHK